MGTVIVSPSYGCYENRQGGAYGDLEQCLAPNAQMVESAGSVGDLGLIPGLGRSPGE